MTPESARLAVLGLGRTSEAVVRWAVDRAGATPSDVAVFVEHDTGSLRESALALRSLGARVELGVDTVTPRDFDLVVASPGIAPHRPIMRSALTLGVPVVSEIELAYRVTEAPMVAVTGTNGKTTTTALIAHLLAGAGIDARAVGNIGSPAIAAVGDLGPSSVLVAECSSYQLALTLDFHPRVAVLLNVTPDHLDWHGSFEAYAADKARIFANQAAGDTAIVDIDDPGSAALLGAAASGGATVVRVSRTRVPDGGAGVEDGTLAVVLDGAKVSLLRADELPIRGEHNVSNALAAAAAALAMGAKVETVRAGLRTFRPMEHRLEPVNTIGGVEYVNDSKATNPEAVLKALTAYAGRPVIVLLGGRGKGTDLSDLARACRTSCRFAVLFGEAREELASAFDEQGAESRQADTLCEAAEIATSEAVSGDVVLLSPACASFDEFADYEERGRAFKAYVERTAASS